MLKRNPDNPIITRSNIPAVSPSLIDVTSVFNPAAVRFNNNYLLLLRVQNRGRETFLLKAESENGVEFKINDQIISFKGIEKLSQRIYHVYDPRITRIGDRFYIMFAIDTDAGCYLGLGVTENFSDYQFIGIVSNGENRNGVLFPEKINGQYMRLDRPNQVPQAGGVTSGNVICLSESNDLLKWQIVKPVISGRLHYWDEFVGSGPPPVKTHQGWLHIYHGVAMHFSSPIYQAGVLLLDLEDPSVVLSRSRYNILEPREYCELVGQVPNVVFPSGMIVDEFDDDGFALPEAQVKLYYGAADTSVCLATCTINDLIQACREGTVVE